MKTRITLLFIFCICSNSLASDENWSSFTYFERQDLDVLIHRYDPPIIYDRINNDFSPQGHHEPACISTISNEIAYLSSNDYSAWINCFTEDYKKIFELIEQSPEQFFVNKQNASRETLEQIRYASIVWCIEYNYEGIEYAQVVNLLGPSPLSSVHVDVSQLPLTAKFFKKTNGLWKYHSANPKPLLIMEKFKDLDELSSIMNAGYCYHSIAEAGLAPFDPPERLKVDSIRERYAGETLFQYPEPDARHAELHAQEPAEEPATVSAEIRACAERHHDAIDSLALKLTALYALIVTYLWRRRRA